MKNRDAFVALFAQVARITCREGVGFAHQGFHTHVHVRRRELPALVFDMDTKWGGVEGWGAQEHVCSHYYELPDASWIMNLSNG